MTWSCTVTIDESRIKLTEHGVDAERFSGRRNIDNGIGRGLHPPDHRLPCRNSHQLLLISTFISSFYLSIYIILGLKVKGISTILCKSLFLNPPKKSTMIRWKVIPQCHAVDFKAKVKQMFTYVGEGSRLILIATWHLLSATSRQIISGTHLVTQSIGSSLPKR